MGYKENRDEIVRTINAELIGPGSDIFTCRRDFSDEIIEGKPLQRYFSGILFPKQGANDGEDSTDDAFKEEEELVLENELNDNSTFDRIDVEEPNEKTEEDTAALPKFNSNTFYPSNFGFSFSISKECPSFEVALRFGCYRKAKHDEISIDYNGSDAELISRYGFDQFVEHEPEKKLLRLKKTIKFKRDGKPTPEYLNLQSSFRDLARDHKESFLRKLLTKLLFKDKYKRTENEIVFTVHLDEVMQCENGHKQFLLSEIQGVDSSRWHKDNRHNLVLHVQKYNTINDRLFVRVMLENNYVHNKSQFAITKEKLNELALFQVEIEARCDMILPFRDYKPGVYRSGEDEIWEYLYRDKLAYGIGHNTACTWQHCEQDLARPIWIKTTFLPSFDVKGQSTDTDQVDAQTLNIKGLSLFGYSKDDTLERLRKMADAYMNWLCVEEAKAFNDNNGQQNLAKGQNVYQRMVSGIDLLESNDLAFEAFRLTNTAIYIQMFRNVQCFTKKDGYEVFENEVQAGQDLSYFNEAHWPNSERPPSWRPFQLAFLLQVLPSLIDSNDIDRTIVDLLYFPTGGGKTEAYLAAAAYLIFWRRLKYPNDYGGVNIIIRYTLRLLSAQQFERATKLILACEFIRKNRNDLGQERISIGFWIGGSTIPNNLKEAKSKLDLLLKRANSEKGLALINPFQLTNCQWCNTKIISRLNNVDKTFVVGHRIDQGVRSYCLNPSCEYAELRGGFPIVLVDSDIYDNPPTVLFGTVDKFATLAWKGETTTLFNNKTNRKPELIIQDELHLLNGPLGSLVGLYENVVVSLCTTDSQKPKIIASTATVKNVNSQVKGLYARDCKVFPQAITSPDDTFFSKALVSSKRKYLGILPTGKTSVMTNLHLLASLFLSRLKIWEALAKKAEVDQHWTVLSYFKSLKEIGRFSNKISSELQPILQQQQVKLLKNQGDLVFNYRKLAYRSIELTSRIPNERIKKNLDKLDIAFDGRIKESAAFDLILATNMISVGLDVNRLGVMVMNGMPPNTAEYIQASSRVARKNEGVVITMFDPFNTRDLSYFEDFVQFHKTFYKQVEPLSVTPFANSALDRMLFTAMITFFRHKLGHSDNAQAVAILDFNIEKKLREEFISLFSHCQIEERQLDRLSQRVQELILCWRYKAEANPKLKFFWANHDLESLLKPVENQRTSGDLLVAMQSMRNVEPTTRIKIKQQ